MIITHFNMQRIVSVSVVGVKKLRHSVKYIIILKIDQNLPARIKEHILRVIDGGEI